MAASFEAWIDDRLLAGVAGSNPTGGMDICLLKVLYSKGNKTVPGKLGTTRTEDGHRLPKQAIQYQPKGRRNIGRPGKRWRDQFHLED